jgi:hypothetical protein
MKKLMIVLLAALLLLAFSVPVMAQGSPQAGAQWGFYGSIRMWTAYGDRDAKTPAGLLGAPGNARAPFGAPTYDDSDLVWQGQDNSRFGAIASSGPITGQVEIGWAAPGDSYESNRVRIWKGTWNFGPGSLKLGQDYTPLFFGVSNQCGYIGGDCGLIFWGEIYTGRNPQITLSMGGFQFGLVAPGRPGAQGPHNYGATPGYPIAEVDTYIPEIEASYTFNLGPVALFLGAGYHAHKVVNALDDDQTISAFIGSLGWKAGFGPFYVNGKISYTQNPGDYGITGDMLFSKALWTGTDIEDVTGWRGVIALGFKLTDMMSFEGGFGMISDEQDVAPGITAKERTMAYYIQMTYSPVKNFFIVPELGFVDYGKLKVDGVPDDDLGNGWYFGIKWQINF